MQQSASVQHKIVLLLSFTEIRKTHEKSQTSVFGALHCYSRFPIASRGV